MSYDPHSNEWLLNRFDIYKDLRARDSAYWCEKHNLHVLTRYDDVLFALNNPKIFSSAQGNLLIESDERRGKTLGASDNPTHKDYKDIVINAYSKDNIERVAKVFSEKTIEHLANAKELDVSDVSEVISAWAVNEIMNIPIDKDTINDLALNTHRHHPVMVISGADPDFDKKFNIGMIYDAIRKRRSPQGPGVYREYLYNNPKYLDVQSVIFGNMVTGLGSLAGALQYLTLDLCYENQLDALLQDRSLIPAAVDESLRFRAAVGRFCRTVTQEVTIHNVDLKPGDRVAISLESANRDHNRFENPDEFILSRKENKHLSWGHGVHACIALAISKELLHLYLNLLLDNIGKYEIVTKPSELKYMIISGANINIMTNIMLRKL